LLAVSIGLCVTAFTAAAAGGDDGANNDSSTQSFSKHSSTILLSSFTQLTPPTVVVSVPSEYNCFFSVFSLVFLCFWFSALD